MRARYVTIRQERWRLIFTSRKAMNEVVRVRTGNSSTFPKDGLCDFDGKAIYVYNRLRGDLLLETLIHEYLHAVRGDCTEEWVTETAAELTRLIRDNTHEECGDGQEGAPNNQQRRSGK